MNEICSGRHRSAIVAMLTGSALLATALTGCTSSATNPPPSSATATSVPSAKPSFTMSCAAAIDPGVISGIGSTLTLASDIQNYGVIPPAKPGFSMSSISPTAIPIYPPSSTSMQAALDQGFFNCRWNSSDLFVTLDVLPAASSSFTQYVHDSYRRTSYDLAAFNSVGVGDQSTGGCTSKVEGDNGEHCELDVLSGRLWTRVAIDSSTVLDTSSGTIQKQLTDATSSVLGAIRKTGAEPEPMPLPASAWGSVTECSQMLTGTTTPAPSPGSEETTTYPLDLTDNQDAVFGAAVDQSGGMQCDDGQTVISVLPGGGWAWPIAYSPSSATAPTSVTVPGASAARYLCTVNNSPACWTEAVIDHALVTVSGQSQAADIQTLQTIASQVGKG